MGRAPTSAACVLHTQSRKGRVSPRGAGGPLPFHQRGPPVSCFSCPLEGASWGCRTGLCLGGERSCSAAREQGRAPRGPAATLTVDTASVLSPHVTAVPWLNPDVLRARAEAGLMLWWQPFSCGLAGLPCVGPLPTQNAGRAHVHQACEDDSYPHRDFPGQQGRPKECSGMAHNGPERPRWCECRESMWLWVLRCWGAGAWTPCRGRGRVFTGCPRPVRVGLSAGTRKQPPGLSEDLEREQGPVCGPDAGLGHGERLGPSFWICGRSHARSSVL